MDRYTRFIFLGDSLFSTEDFNEALMHYKNASTLKPEESYPKIQIETINKKK